MDEFSTTRPPKTTQGTYGTIDDFGGGAKTYSDPRDNPNFKATAPVDTAGTTATTPPTEEKKRYSRNENKSETSSYDIQPKNVEDIQRDMTRAAQGEINALNDYYKSMLQEQSVINQKSDRSTAAINTLTGLAGSTEADIQQQKTTVEGQKANQKIQREAALQVQSVLGNIRKSAVEEARNQRLEARQSEEDRIKMRALKKEEMTENIKNLAASGVTIDGLKTGDKESYDYLVKEYGSEDALKGAFILNTPQDQIIDKKLQGGKYMVARQNPATGKITIETMDTGLPPEYNDITKVGGKYVAVPTGWDGDMTKLVTVGYEPVSTTRGYPDGQDNQYASDLDAIIGATISTIPTKFGQETFAQQLAQARNDGDKINLVAAQVLKGQPAEFKNDFRNQAVAIKEVDKAIAELDSGLRTGLVNNGIQYTFNVVGKDFDPKIAKINQYMTAAIQPYRNSVTGAAWGDQEDAEYAALFGTTKYSPDELKQRLEGVREILKRKSAEGLNSFVNPMGYYGNEFESGTYAPSGGNIIVGEDGVEYEIVN